MDEGTTPPRAHPVSRWSDDPSADVGWDEDFLYYLSRGSEFLLENRVVEAKEELERALAYRPQDARGQDLLAGVYFRLGVYPRAIEIWERLVRAHPAEPTLRVNIGLALLKTGQPEDALEHLDRALEIDPENPRAWGYYGLVMWRVGRLAEARDAFVRGGQASMARRMEELVASSPGALAVAEPEPDPSVRQGERDREEVRTTADAAIDRLHADEAPLVVETVRERRGSGQWKVVESGTDAIPRSAPPRRPTPVDAPMTLSSLIDWWAPAVPESEPLVVSPSGLLLLSGKGAVHARATGLRMVRGTPTTASVPRRFRRASDEVMGDDEPILRWEGELLALVAPGAGERFQALRVEEDVLYAVERFVQAFDDRLLHESGRLPAHAGAERLVQFRGTGTVVLRIPRPPTAVAVRSGQDVRVSPAALLGWTGRLFPIEEPGGPATEGDMISLRGDGTVLLV